MSKQPGLVDKREQGPLSETDMTPITSDENSYFASNENIQQFKHFYDKGRADIKEKIQFQIDALSTQPETQYRNAYIDGLKRAINIIE